MPAPITTFVDINVLLTGAVADRFAFGVPMGVFLHNVNARRISGPYFSLAEVVSDGFTTAAAPEVNAWATAVFSQDDAVDQLYIGRYIPPTGGIAEQVWQVDVSLSSLVDQTTEFNDATAANWVVFPVGAVAGDFAAIGMGTPFGQVILDSTGGTAGVGGTVDWEYWDGSAWVALAGVVDGSSGFTVAVSSGQTVTWTIPTDWAPLVLPGNDTPLFYVRAVITAPYAPEPIYDSGTAAGDASFTATMDDIELYGQLNGIDWYITNIQARDATFIGQVAAWTEPRFKIFIAQSSEATILTDTPGNLAETLNAAGYNRTALIYHDDDDEYLDGAWSSSGGGLNLDVPGGVGVWAYRQLEGVPFDNVTGAQANNIYANAANLYGRNLGLSFTSQGTMAAGSPRFIDVTTSIDWVTRRTQEALLELYVGVPTKIPFTNAGINQVVTAWQAVLDAGVTNGHFSPDVPPVINAPLVTEISATDKANRTLTMSANAVLAGAIQRVVLTLNLSF